MIAIRLVLAWVFMAVLNSCSVVATVDLSIVNDRDMCAVSYTDIEMQDYIWSRESYEKEARRRGLSESVCTTLLGYSVPARNINGIMISNTHLHCYSAYTDLIDTPSDVPGSFNKNIKIIEAQNNGFTKERCENLLGYSLPAKCNKQTIACYSEEAIAAIDSTEVTPPSIDSAPENRGRVVVDQLRVVSSGSGFFVNNNTVVTNYHVVESCKEIQVNAQSGIFIAESVETDAANDLAAIKLGQLVSNTHVKFRGGSSVRVGESILVVGFPLDGILGGGLKATNGIVNGLSGLGSDITKLQISAPIQPGNSGGPLLDDGGLLVGVVVSKIKTSFIVDVTGDIPQNINFAIKSSVLQNFLEANDIEHEFYSGRDNLKLADIVDQSKEYLSFIECKE